MNLKKLSLVVPSAIAISFTVFTTAPVQAQAAPAGAETAELGLDFKLSPQQRRAIAVLGDFAIDQMENLLSNGLNPERLDRVEAERQAQNLRQTFSSLRLDDQQKAVLRTILQTARQQMKRQMGTP
ncbi:MAG: hypothetical protein NW220_22025 [Leptolyngbyaceae cyanobacterium bins.349]|nr:hypothetical protein [Leptolyngbyaceae cyanobacterium bins.349]